MSTTSAVIYLPPGTWDPRDAIIAVPDGHPADVGERLTLKHAGASSRWVVAHREWIIDVDDEGEITEICLVKCLPDIPMEAQDVADAAV